jgi:hypothetical protein
MIIHPDYRGTAPQTRIVPPFKYQLKPLQGLREHNAARAINTIPVIPAKAQSAAEPGTRLLARLTNTKGQR